MIFGKGDWKTYEQAIEKEWLITNGLGGFACSTLIGANSRRYHGLLTASLKPPVDRHLVLSNLDESVEMNGKTYRLASFQTRDYTARGYYYLQRVEIDPLPSYFYSISDMVLQKTVCMVHGENTTTVVYRLKNGSDKAFLRITPTVNFRDYHGNSERSHMSFKAFAAPGEVGIKPYDMELELRIACKDGKFVPLEDCWFYGMYYAREAERGLHAFEDHYIPGYFEFELSPGEETCYTILATIERNTRYTDGPEIIRTERKRLESIVAAAGSEDTFVRNLVAAADSFIVKRESTGAKTVIAGYPWFTDWGRDTMISIPGLTLSTGRFDDAREILLTFSEYEKHGLIPNMFPDMGQEPIYNSVDASLWYFEAVEKYVRYTGDFGFIRDKLFKTLENIVASFMEGTLFNIKMESDGLVSAGGPDLQLTWMDAKTGGHVVTPRQGKAVEINALWYNALMVMKHLEEEFGNESNFYAEAAGRTADSFIKTFWFNNGHYLYDVVDGSFRDKSVRPNQIMAVSLSYPVVSGEMARRVVERVWKELYVTYGLRTLSPEDKSFIGHYWGDQHSRDMAYHQGTVWVWPLGQFVTGYLNAFGRTGKNLEQAKRFLLPFIEHMKDACIGQISEIFDGEAALHPRGCFAQAWSVAEVLRAYRETDKGLYPEGAIVL